MNLESSFEMIDRQGFANIMRQSVSESESNVCECSSIIDFCAVRLHDLWKMSKVNEMECAVL